MDKICAICGKKQGWSERIGFEGIRSNVRSVALIMERPQYKNKTFCLSCIATEMVELPFREAEKYGRRNVIFQDVLVDLMKDKGQRLASYTHYAEKHGYTLKQVSETADTLMTFERIVTTKDQTNFVNCQYCKTRYDANQYFKCPQCGSPNTQTL
jgi:hypothetical protein